MVVQRRERTQRVLFDLWAEGGRRYLLVSAGASRRATQRRRWPGWIAGGVVTVVQLR